MTPPWIVPPSTNDPIPVPAPIVNVVPALLSVLSISIVPFTALIVPVSIVDTVLANPGPFWKSIAPPLATLIVPKFVKFATWTENVSPEPKAVQF
jgi:hypothetical protein